MAVEVQDVCWLRFFWRRNKKDNMKKIFLILLLIFSKFIFAQNRIYFDENFEVTTKAKMVYYRETSKDGNLIKIKDFYKNGKLQFEGLAHDSTPNEEIFEGEVKWYYPDGKIESIKNYYNGKEVGVQEDFDEKGRVIERHIIKDNEDISTKRYLYKDSLKYVNSLEIWENDSHKTISYDEDINGIRIEDFNNGNYDYYDEQGKLLGKLNIDDDDGKSGTEVDYFFNPMKVSRIINYEKNKVLGLKSYFPNGVLEDELNMNGDNGVEKKYDRLGNLLSTAEMRRNGNDISFYSGNYMNEEFLDDSGNKSYISYIKEYKDGYPINQKFYDIKGNLKQLITPEKSINYNIDGSIKYTMINNDGSAYEGEQEYENSFASLKKGKIIFYKNFDSETKKSLLEVKLNEKTNLYEEKIFDSNERVRYLFIEKDSDSFEGEIKVTTYKNGKPISTGLLKDEILQSGEIVIIDDDKSKTIFSRIADKIVVKSFDSSGKLNASNDFFVGNENSEIPKILKDYFFGAQIVLPMVDSQIGITVYPPPAPNKE